MVQRLVQTCPMDTPHHLLLRPSGYYFRVVIPEVLRPYFQGKVEVRRSLRTASRYIALQRAARLWAHLQLEFEKVAMAAGKDDARSNIAGQWSAGEMHFPNGVSLKNVEVKDAEDQANLERFIEKGSAMALAALQVRPATPTPTPEPPSQVPRWTARLGILIEKFLDEHKGKETSADQHNKYVAALGLMAEIIGDKDINHVSIDDVNLVRETLRKVPKHRNNTALYRENPCASASPWPSSWATGGAPPPAGCISA